jgi:L-fuconolactonase
MERNSRFAATRRRLMAGAIATASLYSLPRAVAGKGSAGPRRIIDTHIHLFDPKRPQGAPYTGPAGTPSNTLGSFPDRYSSLVRHLGIVGAIAVEASPWIEDNLWLLETSAKNDIMVGVVGNLPIDSSEFPEYLDRFRKDPLFRGIRYGNLWRYDLAAKSKSPDFLAQLKRVADADLVLDTANPRIDLLQAVLRVSDAVPTLRIVIDHLPIFEPAAEERKDLAGILLELKGRPQVFIKLSSVIHKVDGRVSDSLADHRARLDELFETFGEDRVLFGSDWPNSDGTATLPRIVGIMREYFADKPAEYGEKYFWRNSIRAYKWIKRAANQPA